MHFGIRNTSRTSNWLKTHRIHEIENLTESDPTRTKIEIHSPGQDGVDIETPWVEQLAPDQYRLLNLPFFAYGLSLGDVVKAEMTEDSSVPVFRHVVKKSGHRLLRSRPNLLHALQES